MTTRAVLGSKDVNAPVTTVKTMSKLPMPSKLRLPQTKRPLIIDDNVENSGAPQAKKRCPDTSTSHTLNPLRSKVTNGVSKVNRLGVTSKPVAKPTKSTVTARNPPPRNVRPVVKAKPTTTSKPSNTRNVVNPPVRNGARTAQARPNTVNNKSNDAAKKTKRPVWDLKGRLADIESQLESRTAANNQLIQEVTSKSGDNQTLEVMNGQMKEELKRKEGSLVEANATVEQLEKKIRDYEEELLTSTRRFQRERDDLIYTKDQLDRQLVDTRGDLSASRQECAGLKSSIAQLTAAQAGVNAELSATKLHLENSMKECESLKGEITGLNALVADQKVTIATHESTIRDHETSRRKLHNTIQELKGNIRVFCRVRPLLGKELSDGAEISHIQFDGTENKMISLADNNLNESCAGRSSSGKKFEFSFDRIFEPSTSQQEVFDEISQLVQSALDGYNVCVFAYGQTGSGKTFTMEGPDNPDDDTVGMIPRAVGQIFQSVQELEKKGWKYTMDASFLEIYNETVRDLLGAGDDKKKCEIKMATSKGTDVEVTNSTTVRVTSQSQVHSLLAKASHNRAVGATNCNERSSRSHSVFRLKLTGRNDLTDETCQGTLNLVDLAGSERLSQSGSTGDRLRETKNINKSLSNLGNVIMALANKDSHVPFRNSKLSYLLQNSLGGNSKTLMFVNVSPNEDSLQESLCSLRFATKVNQCNIGTAQKKVK
ncbi:carboxy-terminal kinesin 2-like isoform X1 [Asterias rubens]|uniref:carboxy-terminal kinesin 2-like isoform X1 n=1 Tax=Asterias rubens TaxID=7604 RepID=UPI00145586D0|nr:carboxy-terminal kinesin 2-like isoform X1 [Asterias rubens]